MNFGNLRPHRNTQLSIQVRQRLIHKENLCIPNDSASHSYPLTLTTRQISWLTLQKFLQAQNFCCFIDPFFNIFLAVLAQLETKSHVVVDSHVRIKGIVLEDHGDVPVFWRHIIDHCTVNRGSSFSDVFKTCNHTQSS